MKKTIIALLLVFVLYLIFRISSNDFVASIIPGWHTTILPPYYIFKNFILPYLFIVIAGYLYLKYSVNLTKKIWLTHLILSAPYLIFSVIKEFIPFLYIFFGNQKFIFNLFFMIVVTLLLFIAGQIYFLWQLIRSLRSPQLE